MKTIKNRADLRAEILRLKLEIEVVEDDLRNDVQSLKEEFTPSKIISNVLKNSFGNASGGIVTHGVNNVLDFLLKNILFSRSSWLTKTVVSMLAKGVSSRYISESNPELLGILKSIIHRARKSIHDNRTHFDQSSMDEMDY